MLLLFLVKITCKHCTCISCGKYTSESCTRYKQRTDEIKANSHPSRAVWHKKPDLASSVLHPVKTVILSSKEMSNSRENPIFKGRGMLVASFRSVQSCLHVWPLFANDHFPGATIYPKTLKIFSVKSLQLEPVVNDLSSKRLRPLFGLMALCHL